MFPLPDRLISIGRHEDNDLVFNESEISRYHAQLIPDTGGFIIRDLGSRNGIHVNERRTMECKLNPGDRLRLDPLILLYEQDFPKPDRAAPVAAAKRPGLAEPARPQPEAELARQNRELTVRLDAAQQMATTVDQRVAELERQQHWLQQQLTALEQRVAVGDPTGREPAGLETMKFVVIGRTDTTGP